MSKPAVTTPATSTTSAPKVEKPKPLAHISAKPIEGKPGMFDTRREDAIRAAFKVIHHETLLGCAEVGVPVQFNDNFFSCGTDDLKVCHQQARALISEAEKARWTTYSADLLAGLTPIIEAAQATAREDKLVWDKLSPRMQAMCPWSNVVEIPLTALKVAFGEGKEEGAITAELFKLYGKGVVNRGNKGDKSTFEDFALAVPFQAEAPKVAEEATPASGEVKAA